MQYLLSDIRDCCENKQSGCIENCIYCVSVSVMYNILIWSHHIILNAVVNILGNYLHWKGDTHFREEVAAPKKG